MRDDFFLQARDVHFFYGAAPVLQGVTLEVPRGAMVGLIGPNGAGKTTFLRIITGTLRPQRGVVSLNGTDHRGLSPRERARLVALVPQTPTFPPGLTALETVLLGRNPHLGLLQWEGPRDLEVAHRVMALTDTWELAHRPVFTLSGGERQRVFIARALAQEAPLLLLDEPVAHLDIGYQSGIMDLVQEVRQEMGITVVASMHDLTLAAQYCDPIAVLHRGTVAALGRPAEVLTPELIAQAFGAEVLVIPHPVSQAPVVLVHGSGLPTLAHRRKMPRADHTDGGVAP